MTPDERTQLMKALHDHLWDSALYNKGDWWALLEAYTCEVERGVWEHADDTMGGAWGIIANVSSGEWTTQTPEWQEAAAKWRDTYFEPWCRQRAKGVK